MIASASLNPDEPYFPEPLIRQQAKRVVDAYHLSVTDLPDIEQYIRMRITQGWRGYDRQISQPNTFADRLVDAAASTYVRDRNRKKRDPKRESGRVEDLPNEPGTDRHDEERWVLSMDVKLVIEKLDPLDRRFAQAMMGQPPLAAAREVGITRRKAETALKRIRDIFAEAGLENYLGRDAEGNVAAPTTGGLAGNFGLQPLIGKSVGLVSDARFSGDGIQTVVERLLCISEEDALTIDRKHMTSVTMKLPTRFTFLTNELPRFTDSSGALAGRFLILQMNRSFYGQEDPNLSARLLDEIPGILHWAIDGWKRLRKRGHFVQPSSVEEAIQELEDLSSPVGAFVREKCMFGSGYRCDLNDDYSNPHWSVWASSRQSNIDSPTIHWFADAPEFDLDFYGIVQGEGQTGWGPRYFRPEMLSLPAGTPENTFVKLSTIPNAKGDAPNYTYAGRDFTTHKTLWPPTFREIESGDFIVPPDTERIAHAVTGSQIYSGPSILKWKFAHA